MRGDKDINEEGKGGDWGEGPSMDAYTTAILSGTAGIRNQQGVTQIRKAPVNEEGSQ